MLNLTLCGFHERVMAISMCSNRWQSRNPCSSTCRYDYHEIMRFCGALSNHEAEDAPATDPCDHFQGHRDTL
jgi:hypothetical protein